MQSAILGSCVPEIKSDVENATVAIYDHLGHRTTMFHPRGLKVVVSGDLVTIGGKVFKAKAEQANPLFPQLGNKWGFTFVEGDWRDENKEQQRLRELDREANEVPWELGDDGGRR